MQKKIIKKNIYVFTIFVLFLTLCFAGLKLNASTNFHENIIIKKNSKNINHAFSNTGNNDIHNNDQNKEIIAEAFWNYEKKNNQNDLNFDQNIVSKIKKMKIKENFINEWKKVVEANHLDNIAENSKYSSEKAQEVFRSIFTQDNSLRFNWVEWKINPKDGTIKWKIEVLDGFDKNEVNQTIYLEGKFSNFKKQDYFIVEKVGEYFKNYFENNVVSIEQISNKDDEYRAGLEAIEKSVFDWEIFSKSEEYVNFFKRYNGLKISYSHGDILKDGKHKVKFYISYNASKIEYELTLEFKNINQYQETLMDNFEKNIVENIDNLTNKPYNINFSDYVFKQFIKKYFDEDIINDSDFIRSIKTMKSSQVYKKIDKYSPQIFSIDFKQYAKLLDIEFTIKEFILKKSINSAPESGVITISIRYKLKTKLSYEKDITIKIKINFLDNMLTNRYKDLADFGNEIKKRIDERIPILKRQNDLPSDHEKLVKGLITSLNNIKFNYTFKIVANDEYGQMTIILEQINRAGHDEKNISLPIIIDGFNFSINKKAKELKEDSNFPRSINYIFKDFEMSIGEMDNFNLKAFDRFGILKKIKAILLEKYGTDNINIDFLISHLSVGKDQVEQEKETSIEVTIYLKPYVYKNNKKEYTKQTFEKVITLNLKVEKTAFLKGELQREIFADILNDIDKTKTFPSDIDYKKGENKILSFLDDEQWFPLESNLLDLHRHILREKIDDNNELKTLGVEKIGEDAFIKLDDKQNIWFVKNKKKGGFKIFVYIFRGDGFLLNSSENFNKVEILDTFIKIKHLEFDSEGNIWLVAKKKSEDNFSLYKLEIENYERLLKFVASEDARWDTVRKELSFKEIKIIPDDIILNNVIALFINNKKDIVVITRDSVYIKKYDGQKYNNHWEKLEQENSQKIIFNDDLKFFIESSRNVIWVESNKKIFTIDREGIKQVANDIDIVSFAEDNENVLILDSNFKIHAFSKSNPVINKKITIKINFKDNQRELKDLFKKLKDQPLASKIIFDHNKNLYLVFQGLYLIKLSENNYKKAIANSSSDYFWEIIKLVDNEEDYVPSFANFKLFLDSSGKIWFGVEGIDYVLSYNTNNKKITKYKKNIFEKNLLVGSSFYVIENKEKSVLFSISKPFNGIFIKSIRHIGESKIIKKPQKISLNNYKYKVLTWEADDVKGQIKYEIVVTSSITGEEIRLVGTLTNFKKTDSTKDKEPDTKDKEPDTKDKEPDTKDKEPGTKDKEPGTKDKEPGTKDKEPGTKDKEPGTKDKEPGTKDKEPGTKDKEPGTKDKEPDATTDKKTDPTKDKEPGTKDKEPGTKDKEPDVTTDKKQKNLTPNNKNELVLFSSIGLDTLVVSSLYFLKKSKKFKNLL